MEFPNPPVLPGDVAPLHGQGALYDATTNTWKAAGARILRFPFAFDTPGILTGAPLHTPTPGDLLLDAWVEVDTAWDGTTPVADVGNFVSQHHGFWRAIVGFGIFLSGADNDPSLGFGVGFKTNENTAPLSTLQVLLCVSNMAVSGSQVLIPSSINAFDRLLPAKFVTADPIKVCVSQDGQNVTMPAVIEADNPATVPVTVTMGVNDEFRFGADTYTVAPGTYSTVAALAAAMNAAMSSGTPLSNTIVMDQHPTGSLRGTTVVPGPGGNDTAIHTGTNDFLATTGFTDGQRPSGGSGADPGSTQGAAILYLVVGTAL